MNKQCARPIMVVLAVLAVLTGSGWAEQIAGIVVDEADNPVPGAKCSVLAMKMGTVWQFEVTAETETGDDGRFSLTVDGGKVQSPYFFYAAQHPDYGLGWTISLVLGRQGRDTSDLRLVLPKRGSVKGKVTDSAGNPVEGADVSTFITLPEGPADNDLRFLPPCESLLNATTNVDGAFVLDGLPADAGLMLRVRHPDFALTIEGMPRNITGMPMGTIPVGAQDVTVKLETGAMIEGKITLEETGEPADGATVQATLPRGDFASVLRVPGKTETDAQGRYVLRGLAAGAYSIAVTHPDGTIAPTTVEVATGAHMTNQDIVLAKGVLVSGKLVHAETGEPVSDAQVMAIPRAARDPGRQMQMELQGDGTFSFRYPPGEITLHAYTSSGQRAQLQLTLVEGEDQTGVLLEIEPPLAFKGKVVGPDGKGVAGAQVRSKLGVATSPAETAADGTFELALGNQQPGQYQWLVLDATHADLPGHRGMLAKPFQSESDAEGEIEMKRAGSIRGQVVTEDGRPIASAKVRTTIRTENRGLSDGSAATDESGYYKFTDAVSGMEYSVTATADGYGQDNSERLTLDEGESRELPDLVLIVADQVIEGTLVDEDGNPVAGANINCHSRATGSRQTTTDDKGRFRLENLVDEEIQIWAFQFRPEGQVQGQARAMAGDTDVEIVLGQQPRPISAEERQAQVLAGQQAIEIDVADWAHGKPTTLENLQGTVVLLAFWDSAQESAAEVIEALNASIERHPDIAVIAVHSADADPDTLRELVQTEQIKFRVALDKPSSARFPGLTFQSYRVKGPPAVFIIDPNSTIAFQDIPLGAIGQALETVPKKVEPGAKRGPRKRDTVVAPAGDPRVRTLCANNLKQMGLVFKMYANEHNGRWPQIDDQRGNLMAEGRRIFPEYLADLNILVCGGDHFLGGQAKEAGTANKITDESYFYLGWAVTTEEEGLALLDAYESLDLAKRDVDIPIDPKKSSVGHEKLYRLREGVERFFITDINDPKSSSRVQGSIPVMWDRPGNHEPDGGNVLFLDGHVEFLRYPSKFPMTTAFMKRCEEISASKDQN